MKNLAALQKRIQTVGSKQDRKKNPHDPISNPVFFFSKQNQDRNIDLQAYSKKIVTYIKLIYEFIGKESRLKTLVKFANGIEVKQIVSDGIKIYVETLVSL